MVPNACVEYHQNENGENRSHPSRATIPAGQPPDFR